MNNINLKDLYLSAVEFASKAEYEPVRKSKIYSEVRRNVAKHIEESLKESYPEINVFSSGCRNSDSVKRQTIEIYPFGYEDNKSLKLFINIIINTKVVRKSSYREDATYTVASVELNADSGSLEKLDVSMDDYIDIINKSANESRDNQVEAFDNYIEDFQKQFPIIMEKVARREELTFKETYLFDRFEKDYRRILSLLGGTK